MVMMLNDKKKSYQQGVEDGYRKAIKDIRKIIDWEHEYASNKYQMTDVGSDGYYWTTVICEQILEDISRMLKNRKSASRKKKVK